MNVGKSDMLTFEMRRVHLVLSTLHTTQKGKGRGERNNKELCACFVQ
jgi:hypothetical protein